MLLYSFEYTQRSFWTGWRCRMEKQFNEALTPLLDLPLPCPCLSHSLLFVTTEPFLAAPARWAIVSNHMYIALSVKEQRLNKTINAAKDISYLLLLPHWTRAEKHKQEKYCWLFCKWNRLKSGRGPFKQKNYCLVCLCLPACQTLWPVTKWPVLKEDCCK